MTVIWGGFRKLRYILNFNECKNVFNIRHLLLQKYIYHRYNKYLKFNLNYNTLHYKLLCQYPNICTVNQVLKFKLYNFNKLLIQVHVFENIFRVNKIRRVRITLKCRMPVVISIIWKRCTMFLIYCIYVDFLFLWHNN